MATITLSLTDTQVAHIQAARDVYNAALGRSLTTKQFAKVILRENIRDLLATDAGDAAKATLVGTIHDDWPDEGAP